MQYIAYVFNDPAEVPYMEPIEADDLVVASDLLRRVLEQHARARFAELWEGDALILTLPAKPARLS